MGMIKIDAAVVSAYRMCDEDVYNNPVVGGLKKALKIRGWL